MPRKKPEPEFDVPVKLDAPVGISDKDIAFVYENIGLADKTVRNKQAKGGCSRGAVEWLAVLREDPKAKAAFYAGAGPLMKALMSNKDQSDTAADAKDLKIGEAIDRLLIDARETKSGY